MNKAEKEKEKSPEDKIQWHPGFCAATELMLREHKEDLIFQNPVIGILQMRYCRSVYRQTRNYMMR